MNLERYCIVAWIVLQAIIPIISLKGQNQASAVEYKVGGVLELIEVYRLTEDIWLDQSNSPRRFFSYSQPSSGSSNEIERPTYDDILQLCQNIDSDKLVAMFEWPRFISDSKKTILIEAIIKLPDSLNQYGVKSYLLASLGTNPKANIEDAIRINPYLEPFYHQKARVLNWNEDKEELIATLDKIIEITDYRWKYYEMQFMVHMISEEYIKAKRVVSKAIFALEKRIEEIKNDSALGESKILDVDLELSQLNRDLGRFHFDRAKLNYYNLDLKDEACIDSQLALKYEVIDQSDILGCKH